MVLRQRVKLYDDDITTPHVGRYYDWEMMNNDDPRIQDADMQVDARGSTALLERDIQNQATLNLASVTSNPRYQAFLDPKAELEVILKAFRIQPDQVMATDEQIKKNLDNAAKAQPQDPRIQSAQMTLEAKKMDIADRKEQRQVDQQIEASDQQQKTQELAARNQIEQMQLNQTMQHDQNALNLEELKLASAQQIPAAELEQRAGLEHLRLDSERQAMNAELAVKVRMGSGI